VSQAAFARRLASGSGVKRYLIAAPAGGQNHCLAKVRTAAIRSVRVRKRTNDITSGVRALTIKSVTEKADARSEAGADAMRSAALNSQQR
jgi:hypothetical protein